ncbi:FAD/NAD(P)-binding protein [Dactylosporangium salmoneum]|uniref:FAD/NAD(P)-binding protein n=1 Tax=Dactylosporangium salmoneum TaxID=53361 RepID=A0ABP5TMU3_9ACTN
MTRSLEICLVGAGPRGLCVLERLCAQERHAPSHDAITVHLVDPGEPGPGAVWRTDQSRLLLTNTVAAQITVYTDDSVAIAGPVEPGPSLHAWARDQADAEARRLGPDDYPSRSLYGRYLADCFARIAAAAPGHVTVRVYRSRAVAIADTSGVPGGPQGARLADGTRLHHLDAVVLAQGHVPAALPPAQARTASLARVHGLTYLPQANPADIDLSALPAGAAVLVRGLGLNFFDYVALLTEGRGGRFEREGGALRYLPSGREPTLYATSRRGVPSHARGENQKGASGRHVPRVLTPAVVEDLRRRRGGLRFARDLWPLIAAEVETVYYTTLLGVQDPDAFVARYLDDPRRLLDEHGVDPAARWDWERLARPAGRRRFAGRAEFTAWVLEHLREDVRQARQGNVGGPLKAALDALRDLRNEVRLVVDHGGLDGASYRDELAAWYTPFNAFLSIGPPARRIEELVALVEAGVVVLTGPGTQILLDSAGPAFVAVSSAVPAAPVRATALVEARLHDVDLRRTGDPLLRHMLDTDQCRPYRIPCAGGGHYETGGLDVTERPYRVVDAHGQAHPRRFAYGVPTESVHWVTAAGVRPGVDSVTIGDADAIAAAVRALGPAPLPRPAPSFLGVVV